MGNRSIKCFNKPVQGDPTSFTFDGSVAPIITDTRTLFDAKAEAVVRLGQQFDAIIALGRTIVAKTYQIDDASLAAIQQQYNSGTWPVVWITMDNSTISLSQVNFQAGCQNILLYINSMVLNRRAHKNAIAALADISACDAYDITTGWPP